MFYLRLGSLPLCIAAVLAVGVAAAFTGLVVSGGLSVGPAQAQQPETSIGVDADTTGNTATTLGTIDECVVIGGGDSHEIDIFVEDVSDLLAWEAVIVFEPKVIQIVDEDVQLFMAANEGSDVQDVSGELPDGDGRYWLQAFDAADPLAPDSGTGVLARVTVKGVGPGVSQVSLPLSDLDDDGNPDEGPLLRDVDVNAIADVDGDTLFDGTISEARIAVDASCSDPLGPAVAGGGGGGGVGAITVLTLVVGSVASVTVGGLAALWAVRRRLRPAG